MTLKEAYEAGAEEARKELSEKLKRRIERLHARRPDLVGWKEEAKTPERLLKHFK